jgi:sodium-dependent dicarboxylate transporter 2/3/5
MPGIDGASSRAGAPDVEAVTPGRRRVQRLGLFAGPVFAALAYGLLPEAPAGAGDEAAGLLGPAGRVTAAVAVWMATWWLTEAIPLYATSLLPLAVLPLLGASSIRATAAPYAHELIFLFMGGFLLALAMQRWGLHRRIALTALLLFGERPTHMVGGFMVVTAGLSMWVSNTAAAIIMLPVAVSVIGLVARQVDGEGAADTGPAAGAGVRSFAAALLLGIAYSASIGGVGTPIGTPPNLLVLSYARTHLGHDISFVRWMGLALPLVAVFLPLTWLLLTRVLHPIRLPRIEGGRELVGNALRELGPMGRGERIVLCAFASACLLWVTRPLLTSLEIGGVSPLAGLTDAGVAMLVAIFLFVAPVDWRHGTFALDWETAVKLPWGILVLFGGGLSLAAAIQHNGVGEWIGAQVGAMAGIPPLLLVAGVVTLVVFLTELTSNTATTATLTPVLAALAPSLGVDPMLLVVPAAIAASCAFMLPVATPPNAVIFGSGRVSSFQMSRAGFWLNWIGIALVTLLSWTLLIPLLVAGG